MKFDRGAVKVAASTANWGIAQKLSGYTFGISPVLLCLALIWPLHSGKKVQMMAGSNSPAAHGEITVKDGDNGNRELEIKTSSLAKPTSLQPPANDYVVWLQQPDQDAQNVGALRVDGKLNGDLHTVTAFKRFRIFITAEQNAQTRIPDGAQVLSADVPDF